MTRQVLAEAPPGVEYQITALGKSLYPSLYSLAGWMRENAPHLSLAH